MQRMRWLAYGAPLLVDAGACALVVGGHGMAGVGAHLLAVALAFVVTRCSLLEPGRMAAGLAAAGLVLAMPAVGAAVLAFVAWPSWARGVQASVSALVEVALPDGSADLDEPAAGTAERQPIRQLLRDAASPEQRVRAVLALRHMDARRAVPLLRLAFAHENEDVRLLAFGILEQREKRLRSRIKQTEARLASVPASDTGSRALCHRRLARDQWELVYAGFVSGDLEPVVLSHALEHAGHALALGPDAKMAVLLARVHLRQKQPEQAWRALELADRSGIARATSAPLFAEAAFQMRRFGEIPAILRGVNRAELRRPGLEPVAEFWTSEV